jgi:hypothetical protein
MDCDMHDSWDELQDAGLARAGIYLGDPRLAALAAPGALKIVAIIACAPQFSLEEIEEDMFLASLGSIRGFVRDEDVN